MRKGFLIFLGLAVLVGIVTGRGAAASSGADLPGAPGDTAPAPLPGREKPEDQIDLGDSSDGGFGYSFMDNLMGKPLQGLGLALNALARKSMDELVFQAADETANPDGMGDAFTANEWHNLVLPWYRVMVGFSMSVVVIQVLVVALGISALNPFKRAESWTALVNLVVAALLVIGGPTILSVILRLNAALVALVVSGLRSMGVPVGTGFTVSAIRSGSAILDGVILIAHSALQLYFNIIYMVRKFMLAIVMILWPLVSWSFVSRSTRLPFMLALSELVTNGLMTASHAIAYGFFLSMLRLAGEGLLSAWWAKLAVFSLIVPVSAFIRRALIGWLDILGASEERMAAAATAGIGSILAVGGIVAGLATSTKMRALTGGTLRVPGGQTGGASGGGGGVATEPPTLTTAVATRRRMPIGFATPPTGEAAAPEPHVPVVSGEPTPHPIGFATPGSNPMLEHLSGGAESDQTPSVTHVADRPANPMLEHRARSGEVMPTDPERTFPGLMPPSGEALRLPDFRWAKNAARWAAPRLRYYAPRLVAAGLPVVAGLMAIGSPELGGHLLGTARSVSSGVRQWGERQPHPRMLRADEAAPWRSLGESGDES